MNPSLMTSFDQKLHIFIHKSQRHGHCSSIWKHESWILAKFLDDAENIVPSAAI